jgi:hypothetical protein
MTPETILFGLRILSGGLLLAFVILVFLLIWRDYRVIAGEVQARQRRRGQFTVIQSGGADIKQGTAFPLLPLTSIGRAPINTIVVNDSFASAEHALVVLRGGQWWLEDRGSANGTMLNGEPLEEPTVISSGDVVGIGRIALKLQLE